MIFAESLLYSPDFLYFGDGSRHQHGFDVVSGFGILDGLVDVRDRVFSCKRADAGVQLRILL